MKVKVPPPDPAFAAAQAAAARTAQAAEDRAARNDRFYEETLMPRYLQQMDDQLALGRVESRRQQEMADYAMSLARKDEGRRDALWSRVEAEDTDAAREHRAGMAIADTEQAISDQRAGTMRGLARAGMNPNSGAYAAALAGQDVNAGLAKVMAANTAREAARREGMNLRFQAAGLGGGATSQFLGQSSGMGMTGIGALGSGMGSLQAMQGAQGANAQQWMGMSGFGMGVLGDAAQRGFGQQQMRFDANKANASAVNGAIGAAAGTMMGGSAFQSFISDRRLKENITLEGRRRDGLGVYSWNYVWGGPRFTGVMADEVARVHPDAVVRVGGYDTVDYSKLGGRHAGV